MGEGDVIGNKEGYTSTRSVLTILPEKVIAREGFGIGFAGEFGFLEAGDRDVMGRNKVVQFILGRTRKESSGWQMGGGSIWGGSIGGRSYIGRSQWIL